MVGWYGVGAVEMAAVGTQGGRGKGEASGVRVRSTPHGQKPITEAKKLRVMRTQADPEGEQENGKVP